MSDNYSSQQSANDRQEFTRALEQDANRRTKSRNLKPLLRLIPFVLQYKLQLFLAIIFLFTATAMLLSLPIFLQSAIDSGFLQDNLDFIDRYFWWILLLGLGLSIASALRFYFVTWIGERVVADIRTAVYNHVTGLSPAFFEITKTGEILSRLTTDTTLIQTVVGSTASIALRNMAGAVGAFTMLFLTSPKLTFYVLLTIPVVLVPIILIGRALRNLSRKSQDRVADTSAYAGESLNAIQTVQAFTHEDLDRFAYKEAVEQAFNVSLRRIIARSAMSAFVIFLSLSGIEIILWTGAKDVLVGDMSPGQLVRFIFFAIMLAMSVAVISEVWAEIQRAAGAAERLMELLSVEPKIKAPENPIPLANPPEGQVEIKGLTFAYPTRPEFSALDDFSITINPGETIALVGPSGAGKSTVFQMLLRFYDPTKGQILVDKVDVQQVDPRNLRKQFSVVQQDGAIFSGTVKSNILYGRPEATDEEVTAAAIAAHAHEFIALLPDGYDTVLGERGLTLSGGQRQRLAIARAILRDAPILLLDEATSALDAESERLVQEALETMMVNRTTIVIAHRLATVRKADRIIVMENGRVVDTGTHDELINRSGLYADLARLQFDIQAIPVTEKVQTLRN